MGKDSPSPPPAPDYAALAAQQGAANVDAARATAKLSNPNISGPLGGQTVTYEGDTPTITQFLTPEAQKTLDAQQRVQYALAGLGEQGIGTAQKIMGTPFDYQGPAVKTALDTSGNVQMPVNAGMNTQQAIMSRLQPQLERQRSQLETQLANQGLVRGGEAYNAAMQEQGQRENDLLTQAALQGIGTDISAQNQGFNQALQGTQFENTAAQQAMQQQLGLYNQPLNQIAALMSGSQIQMPQFQGYQGANVQAAPIFQAGQAQNAYNMDVYNAQQQSANTGLGGLFSLGGSILGGPMGGMIGKGIGSLFGGKGG